MFECPNESVFVSSAFRQLIRAAFDAGSQALGCIAPTEPRAGTANGVRTLSCCRGVVHASLVEAMYEFLINFKPQSIMYNCEI